MPLKPLTAEEIAKLRKLYEGVGEVTVSGVDGQVEVTATEHLSDAMLHAFALAPRLIAEVERWRASRDFANKVAGGCPHEGEHAPYCISCCAAFDPQRMALIHESRCQFLIHERAPS